MISTLSKSIGIYDAYKSDLYVAQLCLAAGLFTMLTFIPIYLQSGLGHPSAEAGLMMLPLAVPVFVVPRIVATHLAHRLTGRALLSGGLFLVCLGLFWLAFVVQAGGYGPLTGGMLLTGIGADLRNGETTKVAIRELTDAGASDWRLWERIRWSPVPFSVNDVDWTIIAKLEKDSLAKVNLSPAQITGLKIENSSSQLATLL